jgi:hypothetical protein
VTHDWRCPLCHEPLGTVTNWTYQRRHCSRLTLNRRAVQVDRRVTHAVVHCVCGGFRRYDGAEIRATAKP